MEMNVIVKERRKQLGITQQELADKLGIRRATLSDFERGKRNIRSDILGLIFDGLDISLLVGSVEELKEAVSETDCQSGILSGL